MNLRNLARGLFNPKGDLPKLALGGAWLFAIGSLLPLLWLIWESSGGLMQLGDVFATGTTDDRHSIPLLTYAGWSGMLLIWAQVLAVSGAILLTAFPRFVPLKWQRIGHGVIVGWSTLWTLGAWSLSVSDPGAWMLQALVLTALSTCTVYRAWRGWTPISRRASMPALHDDSKRAPAESPANYFENAVPGSKRTRIAAMFQGTAAALRSRLSALRSGAKT